jgi:glycine C-acetyltransferase
LSHAELAKPAKESIMYGKVKQQIQQTLDEIREAGLYKSERVIETPQEARIEVNGREV